MRMRVPRVTGGTERRLLVDHSVDPDVLRPLPAPLRSQPQDGAGVAGTCLIRLGGLRPPAVPRVRGMTTENAAHRVAVERNGPGGVGTGVHIPRRDTASRLTVALGGRLFPAPTRGPGSG